MFLGRRRRYVECCYRSGYQRNEKLSELVLLHEKTKKKNIQDITQIFKESMHSHDGVTSSQPASSLLFFFYFSFISAFTPRAWPWGKKETDGRAAKLSHFLWRCIAFCQIYPLLLTRRSEMCCYLPGGTPTHYLYGYVRPNGVVILELLV